jgi:BirA family biotin operon repressor/biotin-[acetyl-CoA-carboxylase] ligase
VDLKRAGAATPMLRILDEAGSTNDVLAELVRAGHEPNLSTVITLSQTGGRGRLGRVWVAPPGKTLAASVLLRPGLPAGALGWLPLVAGVAMSSAVDQLVGGGRTGLKWPNDVQVDGLKVCGILAELLPTGEIVMGTGVNLTLAADELPVPTATSLALAGVSQRGDELLDLLLGDYLTLLAELVGRFAQAHGDAGASGIHRLVSEWCRTLGRQVRVSLPGGGDLFGTAVEIDKSGCLVVRSDPDGALSPVAAGDVTHLRYE